MSIDVRPGRAGTTSRLDALRDIVEHAMSAPFYRRLYAEAGVGPDALGSVEDMASLPMVTPQDLIEHGADFLPESVTPYRITSTSGTLRNPKTLYRTLGDTECSAAGVQRLFEMAGLADGDRLVIGQPFDLAHLGYLSLEACKSLGVMAIPGGLSVTNERMLDILRWFRPTAVFTSPSRITAIAHALEGGPIPPLRTILLAGERALDEHRQVVRDTWGVEPHDLYGSEETDGLAGSCEAHDGLHFLDDLFLLELLEPGTDEPATERTGEAVVTSLYSRGTPLVRYRLGDVLAVEDDPCDCGRSGPRVRVLGRVGEVLHLFDGINLYPWQVEQSLRQHVPSFQDFQLHCTRPAPGADEVLVLLQVPEPAGMDDAECRRIADALWHSSLDLDAARAMESLVMTVKPVAAGELHVTPRGKTPKVVDRRNP